MGRLWYMARMSRGGEAPEKVAPLYVIAP